MNVLTIDIGNTTTSLGIFKNNRFIKATKIKNLSEKILKKFSKGYSFEKSAISCVVPKILPRVLKFLRLLNITPIIVGDHKLILGTQPKGCNYEMKILYENPKKLGADRIVNSLGAMKIYGAPVIVVDFGTAITIDAVDRYGKYIGGVIFPGFKIMKNSLHDYTALLPEVSLKEPNRFIGKSTKDCINIGIFKITLAGIEFVINKIKSEIGYKAKVIATGGFSEYIKKSPAFFDKINPYLTLKGLNIIARDYKNCSCK